MQTLPVDRQYCLAQTQHLHLTRIMIGAQQGIRIGVRHPVDPTVVVWEIVGKPRQRRVGGLL